MKKKSHHTFISIIRRYQVLRKNNPDKHVEHCSSQSELWKAIEQAALSRDANGKRHPHQYRLKKVDLELFANNLIAIEHKISASTTFNALHELVESASCDGIGSLTIYDTTHRIGAHPTLNLKPNLIYLHAGTKTGARNLLKRKITERFLNLEDLPTGLIAHGLTASELEDILCIYKEEMKTAR